MWFAKVYDPLQAGSIDGTDGSPHDNAIKRAQKSHYHPPKDLSSDPTKTIYVGRLNFNTTEGSLRSYFEQFGEITHIRLIYNLVTGTSQGYGFITFKHENDARTAYDKANHAVLDDHIILVDYERSRGMKGWIPRRLGGGFGGQKESGQLRFGARDKPFRWPAKMGRGAGDYHISHDQRRADNWCQSNNGAHNLTSPRGTSSRRSISTDRHRSQSPKKRRSTSRHRRQERSSHTSHYDRSPRNRSPRRYYREDRSPRRHYSRDDRSARKSYRDDRSSQRYRRRDDRSPRRSRDRMNLQADEDHQRQNR